jgi:hypothetical protein
MSDWILKLVILFVASLIAALVIFTNWERYKILFVFFLMALFAQTGFAYNFRYSTGQDIPISVAEILYFCLLILMVLAHLKTKGVIQDIGMKWPVRVYLLCSVIGIISAISFDVLPVNIFIEVKSYVGYIFYLYLVPFLIDKKEDIYNCLWGFAIFSVIPLLHVIPNLGSLSAIESKRVDIALSWGALNVFVGYILPFLFVAIGLLSTTSGLTKRVFLIGMIMVSLYALFYSKTRIGWMAFSASFLIYSLLSKNRMKIIFAVLVLVFLVLASDQIEHVQSIIKSRVFDQTLEHRDSSLQKRLDMWEIAKATFSAYPLFGAGWGGYLWPLPDGSLPRTSAPWLPRWHNAFYEIMSQLGLFGLASFYWVWFRIAKISLGALRRVGEPREKAILTGLISAVASIFIYSFGEQQFFRIETASVSWFFAGLLLYYARMARFEVDNRANT